MRVWLLILFAIPCMPAVALAAVTQDELAPVKFGNLVVTDPPPQTIVLEPDGDETVSAGITKFTDGQPGIALLGGFSAGAAVNVALVTPVTVQIEKSGGANFDISDFTFDDPGGNYTADGSGNVRMLIGATLTTNTAAADYVDGAYQNSFTLDLMVNY